MVQLCYKPSQSSLSLSRYPYSSFLFTLSSSWTSNITLINCVSPSFSSPMRPPLLPSPSPSLSLPLLPPSSSLLLFLSLICSESVIYTATAHAERSRTEQSSEGSLTCQSGHHLRNTTKLFSLLLYPCLHNPVSVSSSHHNFALALCTKFLIVQGQQLKLRMKH